MPLKKQQRSHVEIIRFFVVRIRACFVRNFLSGQLASLAEPGFQERNSAVVVARGQWREMTGFTWTVIVKTSLDRLNMVTSSEQNCS